MHGVYANLKRMHRLLLREEAFTPNGTPRWVQLRRWLQANDVSGNGLASRREIQRLILHMKLPVRSEEVAAVFDLLEASGVKSGPGGQVHYLSFIDVLVSKCGGHSE